jgi:hypothetical protein
MHVQCSPKVKAVWEKKSLIPSISIKNNRRDVSSLQGHAGKSSAALVSAGDFFCYFVFGFQWAY